MVEFFSRWLNRTRGIGSNPIYRLAVDVATGRVTWEQALAHARSHRMQAELADGDLMELDRQAEFEARSNLEFGLLISRLTVAAARAKGFEKVYVDLCLNLTKMLETAGLHEERDYYLHEALQASKRVAYTSGERRVLSRMARFASIEHNDAEARRYLAEQLAIGREDADQREDVDTALLLAGMALADGDRATAHDLYQRSARSARRLGYDRGVVEALLNQVSIVREGGDDDGALRLLRQAEDASERTLDGTLRAKVAVQMGELLLALEQPESAVDKLRIALQQSRTNEDLATESRSLHALADAERRLGWAEASASHLQEIVRLEQRLGNRVEAGRAMCELSEMAISDGRLDDALRTLSEAREVAHVASDPDLSIRVHGLLGTVLIDQGNERGALEALDVAVVQARNIGDVRRELQWLLGAGEAMLRFRGPEDAIPVSDRARRLARQSGDEALRAQVYGLEAQIALVQGRLRDAADSFQEAIGLARQTGQTGLILHYVPILARLAIQDGEPERAVNLFNDAIALADAAGDRRRLCMLHGQLARIHQRMGSYERAIEHYERALRHGQDINDPRLVSRALQGLATSHDSAGDLEAALAYYRQALAPTEQAGDKRAVARLQFNLGTLLAELGHDEEARGFLLRARDDAESVQDVSLADQADDLLARISPPRTFQTDFDDDMPLNEGPAPPRNAGD